MLEQDGVVLGEGLVKGVGSMGVVDAFGHDVSLFPSASARGAHVVLEVFGDNPSGQHPPGTDLNQVRVTLSPSLRGWRLHEVVRGDTLARIAHDYGQDTRVGDVFEETGTS